jgi:uncharacterized membrane-anchored protein
LAIIHSCAVRAAARCLVLPVVLAFALGLPTTGASAQAETDEGPRIEYQEGPLTAPIGELAEIEVGPSMLFFDAPNTARLMELMENPVSGNELAVLMPRDDSGWFVVFEFDDIGYVPDDEKDDLDADAILESLRAGTEAANEERRARGWAEYHIVGWAEPPHYDERTNNLSWTIEGESEGSRNLNRMVKLLGRHGVMTAVLVSSPEEMPVATAAANDLLDRFQYTSGNRYAEYVPGTDRLAKIGLSALVVGGAGAVLAKSGLLAKLWKPIAAGLVALGAGIKRFFFSGRSAEHDPDKPIA